MKETLTFVFFLYGTPAIEPSRKGKTIYLMATYDGIMIEGAEGAFCSTESTCIRALGIGTLSPKNMSGKECNKTSSLNSTPAKREYGPRHVITLLRTHFHCQEYRGFIAFLDFFILILHLCLPPLPTFRSPVKNRYELNTIQKSQC